MTNILNLMVFNVHNGEKKNSRVWGWYPRLEEAERTLHEDSDLVFESGTYQVALVEEVPPGYSSGGGSRTCHWYKATWREGDLYVIEKIPEPEWAKGVVCWTMG